MGKAKKSTKVAKRKEELEEELPKKRSILDPDPTPEPEPEPEPVSEVEESEQDEAPEGTVAEGADEQEGEEGEVVDRKPEAGGIVIKRWVFLIWVAVTTGLIVAVSAGAYSLVVNGRLESKIALSPTATPEPAETPSPTPEPEEEVDVSTLSVQVLNGSGVSGAAGAVRDILLSNEFVGVDIGNADTGGNVETVVRTKAVVPQAVFDLLEELLDEYSVEKGDELDSGSSYDVVIILGRRG